MNQAIPFLKPRMVGARFDHAIPLEVLKDLSVLEEMIVEVAKWCYLKDNPKRKRSPKKFSDGVSIKLFGVGDGSATADLRLVVEKPEIVPTVAEIYYGKARTHFIDAINAAEHDEPITQHLPDELLTYFDRIGRSLTDGEAIEFAPQETDRKARLTKVTRRKLVLASSQVQEITEEVTLRGSIPEADKAKKTFELQVINGLLVIAPIASQFRQAVLDAFDGYEQGVKVLLQGIGRYNRNDRLQSIETVEHLCLLAPNDTSARLEEFKALRDGWLDGQNGAALDKAHVDWLAEAFERQYSDELPPPYLYPTAEGGVQAEWSLGEWEITLEIDLYRRKGEWHALDLATGLEEEHAVDLNQSSDWRWLVEEISKRMGGVE